MVQLCERIQPVNIIHCVAEALTLVTVKAELPEQELVVFCQDKLLACTNSSMLRNDLCICFTIWCCC